MSLFWAPEETNGSLMSNAQLRESIRQADEVLARYREARERAKDCRVWGADGVNFEAYSDQQDMVRR